MKLFNSKILPVLTYGIEITWAKLSYSDMNIIENVKARFLKAAMGLSKYTPSRLAYDLARETFLLEDLRTGLLLPATNAETKLRKTREEKRAEIWTDFYSTDAMTDRSWTGPNIKLRSAITRLAVHGFHHKLCKRTDFHEPAPDCICKLCDKTCARYHFSVCKKRTKSLSEYSSESNI